MSIISKYKELGHKGFMDKWKEGIQRITPEQFIKAEIKSLIGSIIGTFVAIYIFIFVHNSFWIIGVIMFFNILLQGSALLQKIQQLNAIKAIGNITELKDLLEAPEEIEGYKDGTIEI